MLKPQTDTSSETHRSTLKQDSHGARDMTSKKSRYRISMAPAQVKRFIFLCLGVLAAIVVYVLMPADMEVWPRLTAATAILMAVWWMTEALPLPVTSLIPLLIFPVLVPAAEAGGEPIDFDVVGANYGSGVIFISIGGFLLALAMQKWNLHRRCALFVLKKMGSKPANIVGGFMISTGFISMWVSNTATTVMMLPIGISILLLVLDVSKDAKTTGSSESGENASPIPGKSNFATALTLGIAYASSIGGMATIIGTNTNMFFVGYMSSSHGINIGFGQWMLVGVPLAVIFMIITWFVLTKVVFRPEIDEVPGGKELIQREMEKLGPMKTAEKRVLGVFVAAAVAWVMVPFISELIFGLEHSLISDAGIGVAAGIALFVLPSGTDPNQRLLTWDMTSQLPWGILLLLGGGIALAGQIAESGLADWLGDQLHMLGGIPTWMLIVVVLAVLLLLTELISGVATVATFLPVISGIAIAAGLDPLLLAVPATIAASCSFMLPVATPPNSIVFGSGYLKITDMVKGGVVLNVVSLILVTLTSMTLVVWVFGITM